MKLAEALARRAQLERDIKSLHSRLLKNVQAQEGEEPAEQPAELLTELDVALYEQAQLIRRINLTNNRVRLPALIHDNPLTLMETLTLRDVAARKAGILEEMIEHATERGYRFTRSEVRMTRTVDVKELRKLFNEQSATRRELDAQIQAANWQHELREEDT